MLVEPRFGYVSAEDKAFIIAFDRAMRALGYDFGQSIGSGYCWGPHMIVYAKTGVKARKVAARIYLREEGIVLRVFLSKLDAHRAFLERTPPHIREVLTGPHGDCHYCPNKPDGVCSFRKVYTLDGRQIEKCSGTVFEFPAPTLEKLPDYMDLLRAFYAPRVTRRAATEK